MDLDDHERALLLAGLFELRTMHAEDEREVARIETLVDKLGGDRYAVFFGAYDEHRHVDGAPVPEYPSDETDEG